MCRLDTQWYRKMKWLRFLGRNRDAQRRGSALDRAEIAAGETVEMPRSARAKGPGRHRGAEAKTGRREGANPYDSSSWQADPIKGLRRVDDAKTVRRNRGAGDTSDPYNTGGFRKGW